MNTQDYLAQKKSADLYFWYQARKILIDNLLKSRLKNYSQERKILDIGCGTGTEIEIIKSYGQVVALDNDAYALDVIKNNDCQIIKGDIENIEIGRESYDSICCFDILEHLKRDNDILKKIHNALKPDGCFFITVPAHQWLFSTHDKFSGHVRRYSKKELMQKLLNAGFQGIDLRYWNFILFIPITLVRIIKKSILIKALGKEKFSTDAKPLNPRLNKIFFYILNLENLAIKNNIRLPFGITIFGSAKK